ncbi:MAG: VUT family protein, partial [Patescibacteria group bacterium]
MALLMSVIFIIVGKLPPASDWGNQAAYDAILGLTPMIGELVDSTLFILIAFFGILPTSLLITLIISNYIFKTVVEILFTPITYKVIKFLKTKEGEDYYDRDTNFNPFV